VFFERGVLSGQFRNNALQQAKENVYKFFQQARTRVAEVQNRAARGASAPPSPLPIAEESPLVYLVAPMLRFHRSFTTLARFITPEIEMYCFDINED